MKFFSIAKDGGPESYVTGFFLVEIKSLFSIVILKFNKGTREVFHSHAFNAITLWLNAEVTEEYPDGNWKFWNSWQWKRTPRNLFHRVRATKDSYAISFRGPWQSTWQEIIPQQNKVITLTHGRKEIA